MFPALEIAKEFKALGFTRLDAKRLGSGMVQVNANKLIDLCLAFEAAAAGDVENLEYSLNVSHKIINEKDKEIEWLNQKLSDANIDVFDLYMKKPDFTTE